MTAPSIKTERRQQVRYSLYGELPGTLQHEVSGEVLTVSLVDISSHGFGLIAASPPDVGADYRLEFRDPALGSIRLQCCHSRPAMKQLIPGLQNMYRCGFMICDATPDFDLIKLMAQFESIVIGD